MRSGKVCKRTFVYISWLFCLLFLYVINAHGVFEVWNIIKPSGTFLYSQPEVTIKECVPHEPCIYPEEVDFRIIVITYNRHQSLALLLKSLDTVELDGDTARLEIWIDRNKTGGVSNQTLNVANDFIWSKGPTRVHVQKEHVGIYGQWIDTWRPSYDESNEVALILEDDMSVSPFIWRWLKAMNKHFRSNESCSGYTLQSENVRNAKDLKPLNIKGNDSIFMFQLLGSWGFAPHQNYWMAFQDWFHTVNTTTFDPYVNGLAVSNWFKMFRKRGKADSMWTIWFIYYSNINTAYCVYNRINGLTKHKNSSLAFNRREPGLHFAGKRGINDKVVGKSLVSHWSNNFVRIPKHILKFQYNGTAL